MSVRQTRSGFGTVFGAAFVAAGLLVTSPLTSGCGSKEEPKKSRSSDDDDNTPSTRSSSDSPSSYGTSMGSSARRPPRPTRPDPLDEPREKPRRSLLSSFTDFVGDLLPSKIIPSSSNSEILDAAEEICRCSDKECVDAISKRMERSGDKRKMEDFSSEEQEAIKKMIDCMMKLEEKSPRKPRPATTARPADLDEGGW